MPFIDYAFIKDAIVVNTAIFEDPSEELLNIFKADSGADLLIPATEKTTVGGTWDGSKFIFPKPYPSWILDENGDWIPPLPMPNEEGKVYSWNEESLNWDEFDR